MNMVQGGTVVSRILLSSTPRQWSDKDIHMVTFSGLSTKMHWAGTPASKQPAQFPQVLHNIPLQPVWLLGPALPRLLLQPCQSDLYKKIVSFSRRTLYKRRWETPGSCEISLKKWIWKRRGVNLLVGKRSTLRWRYVKDGKWWWC